MQMPRETHHRMARAWMQAATSCAAITFLFTTISSNAAESVSPTDEVFQSAVAAWHLDGLKDASGRNELKIVGAASLGIRLEADDLRASIASGNDGEVSLSACFLPSDDRLAVEVTRGSAIISNLYVLELESIWKGFRK